MIFIVNSCFKQKHKATTEHHIDTNQMYLLHFLCVFGILVSDWYTPFLSLWVAIIVSTAFCISSTSVSNPISNKNNNLCIGNSGFLWLLTKCYENLQYHSRVWNLILGSDKACCSTPSNLPCFHLEDLFLLRKATTTRHSLKYTQYNS